MDTRGLKAKEGLTLYNETLGDPKLHLNIGKFLYLTDPERSGKIRYEENEKGMRLYNREDIIAHASHAREMAAQYMVIRDAIAYVEKHIQEKLGINVPFDEYELVQLVKNEQLPMRTEGPKGAKKRLFKREDLDMVIAKIIERKRLEEQARGLMDTRTAVGWINRQLIALGKEPYEPDVLLDLLYHWIGEGKIEKSLVVPGKSGTAFWRYYFSEEALLSAPCFTEVLSMPSDIKPILVTGSKQMKKLEETWGELITKRGAANEGLSKYAIEKRERVRPVGFMGPTKIYPAKFIPKKRRSQFVDI